MNANDINFNLTISWRVAVVFSGQWSHSAKDHSLQSDYNENGTLRYIPGIFPGIMHYLRSEFTIDNGNS